MPPTPRKRTTARATSSPRNTASAAPRWSTEESVAEFEPREHVFSIDDTDYTMPVLCTASIAIQYTAIARERGLDPAFLYGLRALLGDDDFEQVINWKGMTAKHVAFLTSVVDDKMFQAVGGPKGKKT
jgi:hypothetical protein